VLLVTASRVDQVFTEWENTFVKSLRISSDQASRIYLSDRTQRQDVCADDDFEMNPTWYPTSSLTFPQRGKTFTNSTHDIRLILVKHLLHSFSPDVVKHPATLDNTLW